MRRKYAYENDAAVSYYIIKQKRRVDSLQYISDDGDLEGFLISHAIQQFTSGLVVSSLVLRAHSLLR
jgi:hypothetical protein